MHKLYDEDRLPEDQPPILTSNVKDLLTFVYLLTDSDRLYSTIGVVTAWAGEGKTIAALVCQKEIESRFQSILPMTIRVKVMPRSTSKTLAKDVMEELGEQARGDNSSQLASDAALSIERNNLRLLIFDEADRLNDDSFEVVRYFLDKTGCPILLIGLPRLLQVIRRQEKFDSRARLRMSFKSLSLEEVLTVVLPGFVFQRWKWLLALSQEDSPYELHHLIEALITARIQEWEAHVFDVVEAELARKSLDDRNHREKRLRLYSILEVQEVSAIEVVDANSPFIIVPTDGDLKLLLDDVERYGASIVAALLRLFSTLRYVPRKEGVSQVEDARLSLESKDAQAQDTLDETEDDNIVDV